MQAFQVELYRRDTEERARQELQEKLDQVNIFLQVGKCWRICFQVVGKWPIRFFWDDLKQHEMTS